MHDLDRTRQEMERGLDALETTGFEMEQESYGEPTWWEFPLSPSGFVQVRAVTLEEAREKATHWLTEVGILPGPMHDAYLDLCRATA